MTLRSRLVAATSVVACMLLAAPQAEPQPELKPLAEPVLDSMEPAVREQLVSLRSAALTMAEDPQGDPAELAARFGDLGGLYSIYGLSAAAQPALQNAIALAPDDFQWPYLLGVVLQGSGELEASLDTYRRTLELKPGFLPAMMRLGQALLDLSRPEEAGTIFDQALEVHPNTAAAHFGRGRVAALGGDFATAVEEFERSLEIQPGASAVRYPLGLAYRELGRLDDAERELTLYSEQESRQIGIPDPVIQRLRGLATGSSVHFQRGRRALFGGDLPTAEAEFRQAVDADPSSAAARRALGLTLRERGNLRGSVDQYTAAIEIEPGNPLNYKDIALVLADGGDYPRAAGAAQRAIEIDPSFAEAHLILGISLARGGQAAAALGPLGKAAELAPDNPEPKVERALALASLGRSDEAISDLRTVVEAVPDNAMARVNLGTLLELGGDDASAGRELEAALAAEPPAPLAARAHLGLGRIDERNGDFAAATEHYAKSAVLAPQLAPAKLRLASMLARGNRLDEAAAAYAEALELAPRHRLGYLAHAATCVLSGDLAAAKATLETGLERVPDEPVIESVLALILASAPNAALRDGDRAATLAGSAYAAIPGSLVGQVFAAALAEAGRFEEAVRAQRRIIGAIEGSGQATGLDKARARLLELEAGRALREPWRDDPALLPEPWLPLPAGGQ